MGKMGKPARSKGAAVAAAPIKPWVRKGNFSLGSAKGKFGKGASGKGGFVQGKGKRPFKAAPKNAQFWVHKLEEENRRELPGEPITGVVSKYVWKHGWGSILPDNP